MMNQMRKLSGAFVLAGTVAVGMMLFTAPIEAKGKGGNKDEAVCAVLLQAINFPYLSPEIRNYLVQFYLAYGCDPALLG